MMHNPVHELGFLLYNMSITFRGDFKVAPCNAYLGMYNTEGMKLLVRLVCPPQSSREQPKDKKD